MFGTVSSIIFWICYYLWHDKKALQQPLLTHDLMPYPWHALTQMQAVHMHTDPTNTGDNINPWTVCSSVQTTTSNICDQSHISNNQTVCKITEETRSYDIALDVDHSYKIWLLYKRSPGILSTEAHVQMTLDLIDSLEPCLNKQSSLSRTFLAE